MVTYGGWMRCCLRTSSLKLPLVEAWRPWLFGDRYSVYCFTGTKVQILTPEELGSQVAGYVKSYQEEGGGNQKKKKGAAAGRLTYATVMGAGHTVPEYKPMQSLKMIQAFLSGLPL